MRKIAFLITFTLLSVLNFTQVLAQQTTAKPLDSERPSLQLPRLEGGSEKTISDDVDRDLMMAGGQLRVYSRIDGDVYIAGGQIDFRGETAGNLIVAGGNVNISGTVGGNLIVAGGQVNIDETANINGYTMAAGGQIRLNGNFGGPVKTATGSLTLGDRTSIAGNLEADVGESMVSPEASISGEKRITVHERKEEVPKKALAGIATMGGLIYLLSILVSMIVFVSLFPRVVAYSTKELKNFWVNLGMGTMLVFATPIVALLIGLTLVGLPIAMFMMAFYFMALYLSCLIVAAGIGGYIHERKWIATDNRYVLTILGLIIVGIATSLPLVGWLAKFVVGVLGVGILFSLKTKKKSA